jgi:acid phosphatase
MSLSHAVHVHNSHGKSVFLGNCQFGQLIDTGAAALRRLGRYLRRIYVEQLKFLPTTFIPSVFRFRSTSTLRTIHSQMWLVRGLYPENVRLVIETADKEYDPWRRASAICPRLKKAMDALQGGSEWVAHGLDNPEIITPFSRALGTIWQHTNDAATSARCRKLPLPSNLSEKVIDDAVALKARQMQFVYGHDSVFPLFFSFSAAEMLNEMIKRVNGESRTKLVHWSAHDGNVLAFLGFLGYSDGKWPPYGSYIVVELWKFRKAMQLFVQFRYNGKLLKVPRFSFSSVVPFDDFRRFVTNHMPRLAEDCGFNLTKYAKKDATVT